MPVCIAPLIAALSDIEVLSADIQNAYLHAKCQEKIWTRAGPPEFGSEEGSVMIIVRALEIQWCSISVFITKSAL
jgi:hypothetical protein